MIKIAVCGASGRMGQRIINSIIESEGVTLCAALERPGHPLVGQDAGLMAGCGTTGVQISDSLNAAIAACDVLIDFTSPKVSLKNLEMCARHGKSMVIGSTLSMPDQGHITQKWLSPSATPSLTTVTASQSAAPVPALATPASPAGGGGAAAHSAGHNVGFQDPKRHWVRYP